MPRPAVLNLLQVALSRAEFDLAVQKHRRVGGKKPAGRPVSPSGGEFAASFYSSRFQFVGVRPVIRHCCTATFVIFPLLPAVSLFSHLCPPLLVLDLSSDNPPIFAGMILGILFKHTQIKCQQFQFRALMQHVFQWHK